MNSRTTPSPSKAPPSERVGAGIYRDGTYLEKRPTWHAQDSPWKASQILKMLTRNGIQPESLCEVGCGAGAILAELAARFPETPAVGYEISPQAYELCSKQARRNLRFELRDILETSDFYHVIMAIDVFEHVEDYIGFLRKLRQHGRYQLFHIPLDLSVQTVFRASPLRKVREEVGHLHYFTKETALRSLETAGYRVVDWFYTLHEPWRRHALAKLAYLPRRIALAIHQDLAVRLLGGCSLMVLSE
ncbi:MAG: class I SAM-dependent methyltransferase [Terriglobia bacterium]